MVNSVLTTVSLMQTALPQGAREKTIKNTQNNHLPWSLALQKKRSKSLTPPAVSRLRKHILLSDDTCITI
jgi:hypothetical protein